MIGGLDEPTSGDVYIDGRRLRDLKKDELAYLRCRSIGYIFQTFNLIPVMNAIENVELPAIFRGLSNKDARKVGEYALERVGLADRMNHIPRELSGGQQQRVAIARAIVNTPRIILADEPTGNLDLQTGKDIIDLLNSLCRETGVTIVSATHDLKMIDVSNRVAWVRDGRIERIQERADIDLSLGVLEFEKQYSGE
jgi:putative ABC transport system ATP-binding protein